VGWILVVNAGSTSLKLSLVAEDETSEPVGSLAEVDPAALDGVAHRVVHGGASFRDPVVIDEDVRAAIRGLVEVAPLHNAPAIRGIDEATETLGAVPQVAVFDTAFHTTIPAEAATYAVPRQWREEWGIRRYGFHGLSVEWAAARVRASRLVVCHLGGGCSVTAVRDGRSAGTTMGFTPLEGVPMATRSGSVDPGALLHLLHAGKLDADGLDHALNHESGLLGLGGTTHVRELGIRAAGGDADAALALGVFSHRVAQAVAAMAVPAGGLDALAFTAGIGEGSALVRQLVCERLAFLGVELDGDLNASAEPDADVAPPGSPVRVAVIRAREDVVAARAARRVLGRGARGA
jgi:acetate kinase